MKEIKLLFTGVGRRIELIQAFRQAALSLGKELRIYGTDLSPTAPALAFCDRTFCVCKMTDSEYIGQLTTICRKEQIDLVIPTIDTDLLILSQNKAVFAPTKVLVSAPDRIAICRDKMCTAEFFRACGCNAPETFDDHRHYTGGFPCFIKPRDGSSSINAFCVHDQEELAVYAKVIGNYIIQPFVKGTEYTVDVFCDQDGQTVSVTPRVRLSVRSGEVLKTKITADRQIIEECERIIERFCPIGPLTIQLIRQDSDGTDQFIEINPRFGGGSPLSMKAGARSAEAILKLLCGEQVDRYPPTDDGAVYSRFDQSIRIDAGSRQPLRGVIFDLDDTLYPEKQYIASGFTAVATHLGLPDAADTMMQLFAAGHPAIDTFLAARGQVEKHDECLRIYREHMPSLTLDPRISDKLTALKHCGIRIGIITDGRPNGQHNKLHALGLDQIADDIIITDELGGTQFRKPCDIAFRIMQRRWAIPFEQLIYIGDNPCKDPQAPHQLGMQWASVRNGDGLYASENVDDEPLTAVLDRILADLSE